MDILAHSLWSAGAAVGANRLIHKKLRVARMVIWGVLPDLFSFTPVITWVLWLVLVKGVRFADVPRPELLPAQLRDSMFIFRLTNTLYGLSHSIIIFSAFFLLAWCFCRFADRHRQPGINSAAQNGAAAPLWEMTGWLLHILLDIVSHSRGSHPIPVLWPLLDIKLDGFPLDRSLFIVLNYSTLLAAFVLLRVTARNRLKPSGR